MRLLIAAAVLLVGVSCHSIANDAWEVYKTAHGKQYENLDEELKRRLVFEENMKQIEMHNYEFSRGLKSFKLGVNQFTDMTTSEVTAMMNGYKMSTKSMQSEASTYLSPLAEMTLPDTVDWRTKGYVTPVKDQGQCGSCWAFSTTGSLEGQHFRKSGKLVSLSESNLVDCSGSFGNMGCNGGLMDNAFKYIKANHGIDTEKSYPYKPVDRKCQFKKKNVGATDTGFKDIPSGDENALKEAVATIGPISVAIDASHESFQSYESGIYYEPECSSTQLDHGVLAVGYGTEDGHDYWLVKNSWATTWGDKGYLKMSRNRNNNCGIATDASYPLV